MRPQVSWLAADFVVSERQVTVGTTAVELNNNDATRWMLLFSLTDPTRPITITTQGSNAYGQGIVLTNTVPTRELMFRDEAALASIPWYGISTTPNNLISVFEVFYRPSG